MGVLSVTDGSSTFLICDFVIFLFFVYLYGKMFKNISPYAVRSGRTCPPNLGVRS